MVIVVDGGMKIIHTQISLKDIRTLFKISMVKTYSDKIKI